MNELRVMVLLRWAAEIHHNCSLPPPVESGKWEKTDSYITWGKALRVFSNLVTF